MKEFIDVGSGIKIRPEYVVRKEIHYHDDELFYIIKVLGDKEYYVTAEVFYQI